MRPILHPALSRTWRNEHTLQIGVTSASAVVLGELGPVEAALLNAMDGRLDVSALRELAVEYGGTRSAADHLVGQLMSAGAAVDGDQASSASASTPDTHATSGASALSTAAPAEPGGEERLAPDRSSVALQGGYADGGWAVLEARRRRRIDVHGAGRVGAQVALLLAAGGIGDVSVHDAAPVRAEDVTPGGHGRHVVGRSREYSLGTALDTQVMAHADRDDIADFAVLAGAPGSGRDEAAHCMRHGVPHLLVHVVEITGVVGPLVVPGASSCLRCHDLHRTDRDPHWPAVLDQAVRRPPTAPACDVGLAATVAGLAAVQVLAHLDGHAAAAVDGTIEVTLPYGLPRRRSWARHRACGCGWS